MGRPKGSSRWRGKKKKEKGRARGGPGLYGHRGVDGPCSHGVGIGRPGGVVSSMSHARMAAEKNGGGWGKGQGSSAMVGSGRRRRGEVVALRRGPETALASSCSSSATLAGVSLLADVPGVAVASSSGVPRRREGQGHGLVEVEDGDEEEREAAWRQR
jgi:hypothetical protein